MAWACTVNGTTVLTSTKTKIKINGSSAAPSQKIECTLAVASSDNRTATSKRDVFVVGTPVTTVLEIIDPVTSPTTVSADDRLVSDPIICRDDVVTH